MFMQLFFFSKVHPSCHNIANGIKAGSNSNMKKEVKTDKHPMDCSNAVYCGVK